MTDARRVRCDDPDCGHEWESSATDPRCSDPDGICGRSRASPIEDDADTSADDDTQDGGDTVRDADDDGDTWDPLFETTSERTGVGADAPDAPAVDTDDDGESDDGGGGDPDTDDVEIPDLDPEDVRPFLVTIFGGPPTDGDEPIPGFASQQRGEHWQMRDHELQQLSRAYARVGNKYLPYLMAEHAVEGLALLTTITIVAPRLQEDRRQEKKREARERDTDAGAGSVRSDTSDDDVGGDVEEPEPEPVETATVSSGESAWTAGGSI